MAKKNLTIHIKASSGEHSQTVTKERTKLKAPPMYKVILLNDDFTPMDFVIKVLIDIYGNPAQKAEEIMLNVHTKNSGTAGVFSREIAEVKVHQTDSLSKQQQYPLKCILEKDI